MRACKSIRFFFCLVLLMSALASGDKLKLRNGKEYEGKILSQNANFYIIKVGDTKLNILKSMVVQKGGVTYSSEKEQKPASVPSVSSGSKAPESNSGGKQLKIRLKNGALFEGIKISENERLIVIERKGSRVNIFKNIVEEIDSGGISTSAFQKEQKAAPQVSQTNGITQPSRSEIDSVKGLTEPAGVNNREEKTVNQIKAETDSTSVATQGSPLSANSKTLLISSAKSDSSDLVQGRLPAPLPAPIDPSANVESTAGKDLPRKKPVPVPRKRADGQTEIVLRNGTSFLGKISSENERYISFVCEGASINILKKMIKEIDGVPYERGVNLLNTDSLMLTKRKFLNTTYSREVVRDTVNISLKRAAPKIQIPENTSIFDLTSSLRSQIWQKRSKAARMLGGMGQWAVSSIPNLAELLSDTAQIEMAVPIWFDSSQTEKLLPPGLEAGRALALMGSNGFSKLRETLSDPNPLIRRSAVFGLCELSDEPAMNLIISSMKDIDAKVRLTALGGFHSVEFIENLISALKDGDQEVRMSASVMLGKLKDSRAVNPLAELLDDRKSQVRMGAAEAIGEIGDPRGTLPVIGLLDDMNMFVRESAARALGKVNDTTAIIPLISAMKDSIPEVRIAAAVALCSYRDPRAIPLLYSLLMEENKDVKAAAEKALALHSDISTLISSLDNRSAIVRGNAAYMLWVMTGKDFGQDKEKWEEWNEDKNKVKK